MTEINADTVVTLIRSVEYNASYAYHSLYAYFDRDNVALKGFAK
jgi:ferritin